MVSDEKQSAVHQDVRPLIWAAWALILVFWAIYFVYLTIMRHVRFPEETSESILPRLIVTLSGIAISALIVAINTSTSGQALWRRVLMAVVAAMIGCVLHACSNFIVFYLIFFPEAQFSILEYVMHVFDWTWFYISLSAMILALSYGADLRDRERRMAVLAAEAHSAQIRALRYQLNPHFLFNTLNSIAALIGQREHETAERMVEDLSDFLRTGLALDPHDDIPLSDELALHALYLQIERLRFPGRLKVDIAVPDRLLDAMVPSLITQPLIENAVKYAVARSSVPVHVSIAAREEDGRLHIEVADDGGDAPVENAVGTKIGLSNIGGRLRARFGDDCRFSAGRRLGGGFAVAFAIPLSFRE